MKKDNPRQLGYLVHGTKLQLSYLHHGEAWVCILLLLFYLHLLTSDPPILLRLASEEILALRCAKPPLYTYIIIQKSNLSSA